MMRFIFLIVISFSFPATAHAACTSPAGLASQTRYDSAANKMYYCNDANWIDMGGGAAGFSNPATSALNMNSNKITSLGTPTAAGDAANKTYVDGKFGAQANGNWCRSNGTQVICDQTAPSATDKVAKAGDTMTGALTLSGTPTANNHAATKSYVDSVASAAGGGGGATCTIICNGTCPSAPSGWTLAQSTGQSGGSNSNIAAGRCLHRPSINPEMGIERMCCYFPQ